MPSMTTKFPDPMPLNKTVASSSGRGAFAASWQPIQLRCPCRPQAALDLQSRQNTNNSSKGHNQTRSNSGSTTIRAVMVCTTGGGGVFFHTKALKKLGASVQEASTYR